MRILLTNDDGIKSPGIILLAAALREAGHRVFVLAPHTNRSGCSHSIFFINEPLKIKEVEKDSWSCSGTPADCVITALLGGIPELDISKNTPNLILSGINKGANLGTDLIYSGTAAAARQGSLFGIPSVALSLVKNNSVTSNSVTSNSVTSNSVTSNQDWHWESVISFITEKLEEIKGFWKEGTFINVNFPNIKAGPAAIVQTFPSKRWYNDSMIGFTAPGGSLYCFAKLGKTDTIEEAGSDWDEVNKNNASLSVILSQPVSLQGGVP